MSRTPMPPERYAAAGGLSCPSCGAAAVEAGPLDADGGAAACACACLVCGAEWEDLYRLVGYDGLTPGPAGPPV